MKPCIQVGIEARNACTKFQNYKYIKYIHRRHGFHGLYTRHHRQTHAHTTAQDSVRTQSTQRQEAVGYKKRVISWDAKVFKLVLGKFSSSKQLFKNTIPTSHH